MLNYSSAIILSCLFLSILFCALRHKSLLIVSLVFGFVGLVMNTIFKLFSSTGIQFTIFLSVMVAFLLLMAVDIIFLVPSACVCSKPSSININPSTPGTHTNPSTPGTHTKPGTYNIYAISNSTDKPQAFMVDETEITLPPHKEVVITADNVIVMPGDGSDVEIYKVVDKKSDNLTDISKIPSLFVDRPTDNVYKITWEYQTDGHGQFHYPNPPTFSPRIPATCVISLDADGKGNQEVTKNAVRICGSLTIKDPNPVNKYEVTCKKKSWQWARKLEPYTLLKNNTPNNITWEFHDETRRKTTIDVKPNGFKMINMETGVVRTTEYIVLTLGLSVFAIAAAGTAGLFFGPEAVTALLGGGTAATEVGEEASIISEPINWEDALS